MAAEVLTSFSDTPAFVRLCQLPTEKLAQHVLVQRDIIRKLRSVSVDHGLRDQLSYANCQILHLEELLEEAHDRIRRLIEGDLVEWEDKA